MGGRCLLCKMPTVLCKHLYYEEQCIFDAHKQFKSSSINAGHETHQMVRYKMKPLVWIMMSFQVGEDTQWIIISGAAQKSFKQK